MMLALLADAVVSGVVAALAAASFVLVYRVCRTLDVAQAGLYGLSALAFTVVATQIRVLPGSPPFIAAFRVTISTIVAILATAAAAGMVEARLYRRLRRSPRSEAATLACSFGVYLVVTHLVSMAAPSPAQFHLQLTGVPSPRAAAVIRHAQLFVGLSAILTFGYTIHRTQAGRVLRAVADSPELASICGIDVDRVRLIAQVAAAGLLSIGATLAVIDVGVEPTDGFGVMMVSLLSVAIAGPGRLSSIMALAPSVVVTQRLLFYFIGSRWQDTATMAAMVLVLLLRRSTLDAYRIRPEQR